MSNTTKKAFWSLSQTLLDESQYLGGCKILHTELERKLSSLPAEIISPSRGMSVRDAICKCGTTDKI